jgi:hypothetical protein
MTAMERQIFMGQGSSRYAGAPESTKAADAIRQIVERRDLWPYPDVYPPPNSERRNPTGYIVMPAIAPTTPVLVFQYKVPSGFQFDLQAVMFCAVTTGMKPIGNPGDVLYTINRNVPTTGSAPQGSPLADLQLIPFPFGNPIMGPVELPRSENFQPTDIVSLYITNVGAAAGAPNYVVGLFAGWQRKA